MGFQIHRDVTSFENVRYVVFKAATQFVHNNASSRSVKDTKRSTVVTYVKRSFGTTPSLSLSSVDKKKKSVEPELGHLEWLFQLYTSWKPSKARKSDLWCMFQALLRRGGTKAMGKFRRMVKDRKIVRCWTLMLASLLHHTNTSTELRKAWDRADHKNLPLPLTESLRNVSRQFARMLKRLNREKEFWTQEELLEQKKDDRSSSFLLTTNVTHANTSTLTVLEKFFPVLSEKCDGVKSSKQRQRRRRRSRVKHVEEYQENVPDANEPVGSCDATTRLHAGRCNELAWLL